MKQFHTSEGQAAGAVHDFGRHVVVDVVGRIHRDGVAGVDARALDQYSVPDLSR